MHCGCPCEGYSLLLELQEIDFAIVEVTLYLDVYPDCCEARDYLETMRTKRAKLAAEYESKHGMLTMYGVCGESSDKCAHWPWHYEAN
jgi:spore coat protein JB